MFGGQLAHGARMMTSAPSRRLVLRGCGAGLAMLVAARGRNALGMQDSGSISIQGFLCPSADAAESDCDLTDEIFGSGIVFTTPNGGVLTLDTGTSHAVSHVWDGLSYGDYYLQSDGSTPDGYYLDHIDGVTTDDSGDDVVELSDSNSTVSVNLIYVPTG